MVAVADGGAVSVKCPACDRAVAVTAARGEPLGSLPAAGKLQATGCQSPGTPDTREGPAPVRTCTFCLEPVHPSARKCPHCQEYLDPALADEHRPAPPTSQLALASFVLALVSPFLLFLPAPVAVLLGAASLLTGSGGRTRGKGMAIAGLLLGLVWTAVLVFLVLITLFVLASFPVAAAPKTPPGPPFF